MKDKLIIIGAGGQGKVAADIAVKMNQWERIFFLEDNDLIKSVIGFEVIGKAKDADIYKSGADFFVAIGNNENRAKFLERLLKEGFSVVNLIHPSSILGMDVKIDFGTIIMAGVIVNSSTRIGKGCILNTNCNIDHDNFIEDYVHISPGVNLAGSVFVGNNSWIGIGSSVSNNVSIISDCVIGAGSVVIQDINVSGTYVGVPAKRIH